MNALAELFKLLIVRSTVAVFNFIRRHPWASLAVVVFFVVLPFLIDRYLAAKRIFLAIANVLDWFKGVDANGDPLPLWQRAIRWVLLLLLPGGFILFSLATAGQLIARERFRRSEFEATHTTESEQDEAAFSPSRFTV